jgi:hypothetical protein
MSEPTEPTGGRVERQGMRKIEGTRKHAILDAAEHD